ncbi:MAG: hypothetical protein HOP29_16845 [Phycisphaerales bacterium]|nr:hypothetical protein [Phycisphaerales bacterium]
MNSSKACRNAGVVGSIVVVAVGLAPVARAAVCYVDGSRECECGTSGCVCDGAEWETAYRTLQEAIAGSCTDIRVAEGTYRPTGETDRSVSFLLETGVTILGGFPAGGGDMEERNPDRYVTILTGDLNDDDSPGGGNAENSYHVVNASGASAASVLDGFTITGGNADGDPAEPLYGDRGGGILVVSGAPTIRKCVIRGNAAGAYGGGLAVARSGAPPVIEDCLFENNTAGVEGGSIHVAGCPGQGDCEDHNVCTYADCVGSSCTYDETLAYGDVNGSGGPVDIFDLLCVLDGFAGVFIVCPQDNLDIVPCNSGDPPTGGDRRIDIFDVLSVLDAFGGTFACDCPAAPKVRYAGGSPKSQGAARRAKMIASDIEVQFVARDGDIGKGETTVLDAFAEHVENFRGYQLRLSADGGVPIAAFVDAERSDFVFAGREFRHKSDPRVHRIVAALLEGEVTTASRVYLGTFVVRANQGGGGTMEVRVHPDDGMILVDPTGRVHNAPMPEQAEVTVR